MGFGSFSVIYGCVMTGRDVEVGGHHQRVLDIEAMSPGERRSSSLGRFRSHFGYPEGVFVGTVLCHASDEGAGSIPMGELTLEPTAEQIAQVEKAIEALPEEFRTSRHLRPLGTHVIDLVRR